MKTAVYPSLLGSAWRRLAERVRRVLSEGKPVAIAGSLRIRRGPSLGASLLAELLSLPSAARAVRTTLVITPTREGEAWWRVFGDRPLVTSQTRGAGRALVERVGILEFRFRLEALRGGLFYRQAGVSLRIGPMAIALPRWLSPRVEASEEPGPGPEEARLRVKVTAPIVGFLVSY